MKQILAATFAIALGSSLHGAETGAMLRVAHLSPDAPAVDVWLDGTRVLESVPFKAVSGYLPVPAGDHQVQVTPAGAAEPVVIDAVVTLDSGKAYTAAATGLLGAGDLQPLVLVDDRKVTPGRAEVRFVHASPDAPAVDVAVTGGPVLFSDVSFREAAEAVTVKGGTYDLEVRLAGTADVALSIPGVVLQPTRNYTAFAVGLAGDGSLSAVLVIDAQPGDHPPYRPSTAFVPPAKSLLRVAHLSPDAPSVDVWVDGERAVEGLAYSNVTEYLKVPAGERRIQVTPAGASEPIVIDVTATLDENAAYTAAATGLLGAGDLQPLLLVDDRTAEVGTAKVRFVHASPDAPAVDVAVTGGPVLLSDVSFREATDYLGVEGGTYDLEVRVAGTDAVALALPGVELPGGANLTVFAIGLAGDGTLAALPVVDAELRLDLPRVRVAHLSPDAPQVDVWVDGEVVLRNVAFGEISEYLPVPVGERRIQVTPAGASEPVVIDATLPLAEGTYYTVAATGLLGAGDLSPLALVDERRPGGGTAEVRFVHASPDAPAVDVAVAGGDVVFGDVSFRESTAYSAVPPGRYDLEVRLAGTDAVALSLPGIVLPAGQNITVFAVGLAGDGSLAALKASDAKGPFLRSDANGDDKIDISDAIGMLHHLFSGEVRIQEDAADANDDATVDVSDAVYTLAYLFQGGAPPKAPFPGAGFDPTPDLLDARIVR